MFGRWLSNKPLFFDLFNDHVGITLEAVQHLYSGLSSDLHKFQSLPIKILERRANDVTRLCTAELHKTFITPLDRDDIYLLISRLDDIINSIDKVANRLVLYKIKTASPDLLSLTTTLLNAVIEVEKSVKGLQNLKQIETIQKSCEEIDGLEHEANVQLRSAIGRLFDEEPDAREIIKWKELYETLEKGTNCCAEVAEVVEGILLEKD